MLQSNNALNVRMIEKTVYSLFSKIFVRVIFELEQELDVSSFFG